MIPVEVIQIEVRRGEVRLGEAKTWWTRGAPAAPPALSMQGTSWGDGGHIKGIRLDCCVVINFK